MLGTVAMDKENENYITMETTSDGCQGASDMLEEALKQLDGILAGTLKREKKRDTSNSAYNASPNSYQHPQDTYSNNPQGTYTNPQGTYSNPQSPYHTPQSAYYPPNGLVENGSPRLSNSPKYQQGAHTVKLLNDLKVALEVSQDEGRAFRQLSAETQLYLQHWMQGNHSTLSNGYSSGSESSDDKIRKLETDKENLSLQVSVLSDQIEAQVEKIRDLERLHRSTSNGNMVAHNGHNGQVDMNGGDQYYSELLNRNSPHTDTHKLDLMAENSNLKLRLSANDREKGDLESRLAYAQKRIDDLQSRLNDQTIEMSELRGRASRNGTIPSSPDPADMPRDRTLEREKTLDRLKRKHSEVEKLKKAVESLMVTNSEKDQHIDALKKQVRRYHRLEEAVISTQGRRGLDLLQIEDDHSDSRSTHSSNTSGNDNTVRDSQMQHRQDQLDHLPPDLRNLLLPNATSTPVAYNNSSPKSHGPVSNGHHTTPPSCISSPRRTPTGGVGIGRSSSFEDVKPEKRSPQTSLRSGGGYGGTLPKDARLLPASETAHTTSTTSGSRHRSQAHERVLASEGPPRPRASTLPKGKPPKAPTSGSQTPQGGLTPSGSIRRGHAPETGSLSRRGSQRSQGQGQTQPRKQRGFMSFGKGFFKRSGKWSSSAPNLAQTETDEEALKDEMAQEYKQLSQQGAEQQQQQQQSQRKKKGIKRFFGKLRRSNSQEMDPEKLEEFKRSGLRATAGPRLGWSRDLKYTDIDVPFARWDTDRIAAWLHGRGLSMYVGECKRWVKNGDHLLNASLQDLEKELGVRNHYHRKKLQLALQAMGSETKSPMDDLDYNWVTRWLDDIGLPQYKDQFSDARVDGRMLHYLTIDDLVGLKVTNTLHHLSFKRAIQVLRYNNFNAACLKRRPVPEEGDLENKPGEVMLWTNHRVMEWLRSIDLSEYAPNLRGSGVHGGLMVMEPKFTPEIFASLLSIPASKTLLRRHLSTHYVALIGSDIQAKKRDIQSQVGYTPLTPNQKVKLKKRIFGHKRTKSETDEDLVCPVNGSAPFPISDNSQSNGGSTISKEDKECTDQTAREIGAFSYEINSLTNMLSRERFLDDVPTSDV